MARPRLTGRQLAAKCTRHAAFTLGSLLLVTMALQHNTTIHYGKSKTHYVTPERTPALVCHTVINRYGFPVQACQVEEMK